MCLKEFNPTTLVFLCAYLLVTTLVFRSYVLILENKEHTFSK